MSTFICAPTGHLTLDDLFAPQDLTAAIDASHVTRKSHPELPLSIYTYTAVCQYAQIWTPITTQCRGLIADDRTGEIVALPFPKIFVTGLHTGLHAYAPALPTDERFEIFEKADGSLIIVFHYAGRWHAASKGSFISEQAQWAQALLDRSDISRLDPGLTYLAEAIYPGNRIVVDYGGREELMLLAAFRPADGTEELLSAVTPDWAPIGPVVRSWGLSSDITALEKLATQDSSVDGRAVGGTEEEGWIVRFESGLRAKIKLSAYLTLHRLYTGTNQRTVWAALANGEDLAGLFDRVPDEFREWVDEIAVRLRAEHKKLIEQAGWDYAAIVVVMAPGASRKEFAAAAAQYSNRSALFLLHDQRYAALTAWAWKQVRPAAEAPFKAGDE
jgi:RNA ligase